MGIQNPDGGSPFSFFSDLHQNNSPDGHGFEVMSVASVTCGDILQNVDTFRVGIQITQEKWFCCVT